MLAALYQWFRAREAYTTVYIFTFVAGNSYESSNGKGSPTRDVYGPSVWFQSDLFMAVELPFPTIAHNETATLHLLHAQ